MIRRLHPGGVRDDEGAFALIFALLMLVVVGITGIGVDLGSLRMDRESDRSATDAAATAGAGVLASKGPQAACLEAMNYALSSLGLTGTPDCSAMPTSLSSCPAAAISSSLSATPVTITVRWPIPDTDSALSRPDIRPGVISQPADAADGQACGRIGVSISKPRQFRFASLFGISNGTTQSTSIALAATHQPNNGLAPLVALDPSSCNAVNVNGGAQILVTHTSVPDSSGVYEPGRVIVDSDGSGGAVGCNGQAVTIDTSNNSSLRVQDGVNADGSAGALGTISSYAVTVGSSDAYQTSDTQGCVHGPSNVQGSLCPVPTSSAGRVGTSAFDTTFNCKLSNGCTNATSTSNYIDQFASFAASAPYTTYSSCTTPQLGVTIITGNVVVNCPSGFKVRNTTVFTGNVVIFKGDLLTSGSGSCVAFGITAVLGPLLNCVTPAISLSLFTANPETEVYVAGGVAIPSNTSLIAPQTFMMIRGLYNIGGQLYQSAPYGQSTTGIACAPSTASTPPTASCFAKLSVWDDFTTTNQADNLSGNGSFLEDGAMYFPNGEFDFTGTTSAVTTSAQFVAYRITITGGAQLTLVPSLTRQIAYTVSTGGLIR